MENAIDGILLIDKNEGESSYDVVRKVKSAFNARKGMKTGHAGTLDPFATGMLVILLGQGTKLSPFIMSERKVYLATVMLGVETDTLDPTGQVIR
ncbi:MAG TPA: tRNA pseudouridine(55) synthase TruB, partial [Desulfobacteraceae bacterium]|nr:tRNA pseudouridine(55) synthase TruB [Desulfobacteraceae bacterium]